MITYKKSTLEIGKGCSGFRGRKQRRGRRRDKKIAKIEREMFRL